MAKHNAMTPDTPLHRLAPGALAKLTPQQRGRALKRTKKGIKNHAALVTPRSILGK